MVVIPIFLAYLIGAIPFGLIVARIFGIEDIRKHGSGNIGATNVWRIAGGKAAAWVFASDMLKGSLAVLIAQFAHQQFNLTAVNIDLLMVSAGVAAVLGHVFPVYLKFKGGKGVNTAFGVMATLLPVASVIGIGIFGVVALITRYISLGSMLGALSFCLIVIWEKFGMNKEIADIYIYISILMTLLILITHHQNIRRLLTGTESRFSFSSKKKDKAE